MLAFRQEFTMRPFIEGKIIRITACASLERLLLHPGNGRVVREGGGCRIKTQARTRVHRSRRIHIPPVMLKPCSVGAIAVGRSLHDECWFVGVGGMEEFLTKILGFICVAGEVFRVPLERASNGIGTSGGR
jgi:hypothetical protein